MLAPALGERLTIADELAKDRLALTHAGIAAIGGEAARQGRELRADETGPGGLATGQQEGADENERLSVWH